MEYDAITTSSSQQAVDCTDETRKTASFFGLSGVFGVCGGVFGDYWGAFGVLLSGVSSFYCQTLLLHLRRCTPRVSQRVAKQLLQDFEIANARESYTFFERPRLRFQRQTGAYSDFSQQTYHFCPLFREFLCRRICKREAK